MGWRKYKIWSRTKDGIAGYSTAGGRRWWVAAAGLIVFIFGCWLLFGSGLSFRENAFIALLPIITIAAGVYFTIKGVKVHEVSIKRKKTKEEKQAEVIANTINVCVQKNSDNEKYHPLRVEFVHVETPTGAIIEITNLKKYYYVNSVYYGTDGKVEKTVPWELPDGDYLSPRKYVIPLLMKAYEVFIKYNRSKTKFQQVSTVTMLIAFGITTFVFFLILTG